MRGCPTLAKTARMGHPDGLRRRKTQTHRSGDVLSTVRQEEDRNKGWSTRRTRTAPLRFRAPVGRSVNSPVSVSNIAIC